jgi:hypothetical protein
VIPRPRSLFLRWSRLKIGTAQDYNKINGRQPPVLRTIKLLAGGEIEDRGPRFSQHAVQQGDDREKSPITWTILKLNLGNMNSSGLLFVNTYSNNLW